MGLHILHRSLYISSFFLMPSGQFRDHMTQGMEYGAHGKHRIEFYEAVVTKAKVWNNSCVIQAPSSCNVKVS